MLAPFFALHRKSSSPSSVPRARSICAGTIQRLLIALIRPARTIGMFARLDRDEFRPNDNMTAFRIAQDRKCVPVIRHVDTVTTLGSKTYYCFSDRTMCRPMLLLFETKLARREARFRHFRELCRAGHSCLARPSHPKSHGTGS